MKAAAGGRSGRHADCGHQLHVVERLDVVDDSRGLEPSSELHHLFGGTLRSAYKGTDVTRFGTGELLANTVFLAGQVQYCLG